MESLIIIYLKINYARSTPSGNRSFYRLYEALSRIRGNCFKANSSMKSTGVRTMVSKHLYRLKHEADRPDQLPLPRICSYMFNFHYGCLKSLYLLHLRRTFLIHFLDFNILKNSLCRAI